MRAGLGRYFDWGVSDHGLFAPNKIANVFRTTSEEIARTVGLGKDAVSLDTFNNPAKPPPKVGEKTEISFSSADLLVLH